ncbi:hypothetical protein EDC04DRAFT_2601923 [Pisolithus marmoratus]|nr:hypothetical protein EDC04DRAFT_2601923 [Pisolithus marmoratus]
MLLLSWIALGGGRGVVILDLLDCTEVHSVPSPMHSSAKEDASAIATRAKAAGDQGLALFSYCTWDGFERLGANIFTASKMLSSARSSSDDPTLASNHGHTITGLTTNRTALEFASGNSNTWHWYFTIFVPFITV